MSFQSNFIIKKFTIKVNNRVLELDNNTIFSLEYYESLDRSFIYLAASIYDSTFNFSENIYGLEEVELEFDNITKNFDGTNSIKTFSFTKNSNNGPLYVYSIYNKDQVGTKKTFTLGLCRLDAINDKFTKISKKFPSKNTPSKPEEIVQYLLKQYLKTEKIISAENSATALSFVSPMSTVYGVINWMIDKCISAESKRDKGGTDITAGYVFYENYDSYNFVSIDKLCSQEAVNPKIAFSVTQNYEPGAAQDVARDAFIIKNSFNFNKTIDVFQDLDMGFYSNKIAFFEAANQKYTEKVLNLEDYYSKMTFLGSQNELPSSIKDAFKTSKNTVTNTSYSPFGSRPSRLMTVSYNEALYLNPNQKIDYKKSIGQSLVRYGLLGRQIVTCRVFGNLNITIGQVIRIEIYKPEKDQTTARDKNYSGKFLVYAVAHIFNNSGSGGLMMTELVLVKDSFGE